MQPSANPPNTLRNRSLLVLSALLFTASAVLAQTKQYTSIVVFGDSLSDTGNVADLTQAKYDLRIPGLVADYTDGRFTDGYDTIPASRSYSGVWIEQLAATLPGKPRIRPSLEGGTDYAYGFATTGGGTAAFTFGPSDSLSVKVDNIGQQITSYLATHPKINDSTLFVVWGGAIDVLYATRPAQVLDAALKETVNIQRLIQAGATQFLIPNLPPLGAIPRLNTTPTLARPATDETVLYNDTLTAGLDVLPFLNFGRHLTIRRLDVFGLFRSVLASPASYSIDNVTEMSQGNYLVNPDTYLFWDDIHPTTHGHNILARAALNQVSPGACQLQTAPDGISICEPGLPIR